MANRFRASVTLLLLVPLALSLAAAQAVPAAAATPHIDHLFIIVLENEDADDTFGANPPAPYLGTTLKEDGAFIPNYFGIGHHSLDNYLAMISGQPPNQQTQADCGTFTEMTPGTLEADGVAVGQGCAYPGTVHTVANQLEEKGVGWRGYMQDMPTNCSHPVIGGPDMESGESPTDLYATRHDPFVYFHSIVDKPACQKNVVNLDQLPKDLRKASTTPAYSFITPDVCSDGHDATCADPTQPAGFAGINAFLSEWVPRIQASPAYDQRGAILITFDESETGAQSCCGEKSGPNTPSNGDGVAQGDGGGQIGAVMLSPCVRPGTVTQDSYNHYSMLNWVEDDFGLAHLAEAGASGLRPFGRDVFDRPDCQLGTKLQVRPRKAVVGKKTTFRFELTTQLPACRKGAIVSFAGLRARTNDAGKAQLRARPTASGTSTATVTPPICEPAKARVRVLPAA